VQSRLPGIRSKPVFRAILLYLSSAKWARSIVTKWGIARRFSARFVVGDSVDDALVRVKELNAAGLSATLDHLGENVSTAEEALQATDTYIEILQTLDEAEAASGASLKLSQLGLGLDYDLCLSNMRCIASRAKDYGTFVRIDMEDSHTVDNALRIYKTLQEEGFTNIGVVIQAYLYRSEVDVRSLLGANASIRLCKGAYKEPAEIAFPSKKDVDSNFDRLAAMMIDQAVKVRGDPITYPGKIPPRTAIASHDEARIVYAKSYAETAGLQKEHLEFQMLNGIRPDLQIQLAREGYPVRIYVPYGIEWYPYFMRRLAERPANVWFFVSNYFRT
jgi:proline dehydrogenase